MDVILVQVLVARDDDQPIPGILTVYVLGAPYGDF